MRGRVRSTRSLVRPRHGAWIELWGIAGFDAVALQSVPAKCPIISGAFRLLGERALRGVGRGQELLREGTAGPLYPGKGSVNWSQTMHSGLCTN
jgi:hypothetical protein